MTASMENTAAELIAIHHDEATKVALEYIGVAVVAINDRTGNGIRDVAPTDGKRLAKEIIVSNTDRNGKKGMAEAKSLWETSDLALSCLWSRRRVIDRPTTDGQFLSKKKSQLTWPGSPVIQQVATPSWSSISTAYSSSGTLSPPVIHTSTPLILNGIFYTADDPFPKGQVEVQTKSKVELGGGQKECKGM